MTLKIRDGARWGSHGTPPRSVSSQTWGVPLLLCRGAGIEAVAASPVDDVTQPEQTDTQDGDASRLNGRHGGGREADLDIVRTLRTKEDFAGGISEVCQVQAPTLPSKSRSLAETNCTLNTDSRSRAKLYRAVGARRGSCSPVPLNGEIGDVGPR